MGAFGSLMESVGGIVGAKQQQGEMGRQQAEADKLAATADAAELKAKKSIKDYTVGKGSRQAFQMSQQDKAGDIAKQEIQKQTGAALGAMKAGGAKALMGGGGASALAASAATQQAKAASDSQARKMAGQQTFGAQEQSSQDATTGMRNEMAQFDRGRALAQGDAEKGLSRSLTGDIAASKMAMTQDIFSTVGGMGDMAASAMTGGAAGAMGMMGKKGMKIKETPGEFSHGTNPIDLVRNGTKIGEATGGELIFNPEQSGKLETLATEGGTELHKYLRGLFKKFNKKS
tara:strand:+ start:3542 stop:4405 length:864 start_codon:yes stop_codon:yes gene_type:complete